MAEERCETCRFAVEFENRRHPVQVASADIAEFLNANPPFVTYDVSAKTYVLQEPDHAPQPEQVTVEPLRQKRAKIEVGVWARS